jgi:uncharacterized protein involved in outer membrane biogenesis
VNQHRSPLFLGDYNTLFYGTCVTIFLFPRRWAMEQNRPLYQRVWFWAVALFLTYILLMGAIIPRLSSAFLPTYLANSHRIYLRFEKLTLNPFTFQGSLHDLRLDDQHGATALRIKEIGFDLALLSLIKQRIVVDDLRIDAPRVFITITKAGTLNLTELLPPSAKEATPATSKQSTALDFLLRTLTLNDGSVTFTDASKEKIFSTTFEGLSYQAHDISTRAGAIGSHQFSSMGALLEEVGWKGGFSLNPVKLYGSFWLSDAKLEPLWEYLLQDSPYVLEDARASFMLPYHVEITSKGVRVLLEDALFHLRDGVLLEASRPLASLKTISLESLFASLHVNQGEFTAALQQGHLSLDAFTLTRPFGSDLGLHVNSARIHGLRGDYTPSAHKANVGSIVLGKTSLSFAQTPSPFAGFEALRLNDIALHNQRVHLADITLEVPFGNVALLEDGSLDVMKRLPSTPDVPKESTPSNEPAWEVALGAFMLKEGAFTFRHQPQTHQVSNLELLVNAISTDASRSLPYSLSARVDGGSLNMEGSVRPSPFDMTGNATLSHPNLPHFASYVAPLFKGNLQSGALDVNTSFHASLDPALALDAKSAITLHSFALTDTSHQPLLSWERLKLDELHYTHAPFALHAEGITLQKPYASLHIYEDMSTNFGALLPASDAQSSETSTSSGAKSPPDMRFSEVALKEGALDFADDSLPLPFATKVHDLHGSVSTVDFATHKPADIALEGLVNEYGFAQIKGQMLPFDLKNQLDLSVLFKNIDITRLSPYSGKFAGYKIQEGKLDVELDYEIRKHTLVGQNNIILDSLTLGEKIESPDALDLPLGLAIALLKDRNGQIDINLPVTGDLNDPQFSYGAIVMRAVTNLITGIVSAPFRLLGNLLGVDGEALKSVDFEAGAWTLLPSEQEKMAQYAKILEERPQLSLRVASNYHAQADTQALQKMEIETRIATALDTNDNYEAVLEALYLEAFSEEDLSALKTEHTQDKKLNLQALHTAIKEALASAVTIPQATLDTLATNRAKAIKEALIAIGVEDKATAITPPTEGALERDRWVQCAVEVAS